MNGQRTSPDDKNKMEDPAMDSESDRNIQWLPDPPLPYKLTKSVVDVVVSILALLVLLPLFILIMLAIKLTSEGPVFVRQTRLGYHAKPFQFLKFRSMYKGSNSRIGKEYVERLISGGFGKMGETPVYKIGADPRITPIGRVLRRTSLDELPQFINVLLGQMSLVGPRPALPYEWQCYEDWHKKRLSCRPGITGLWQVRGMSGTTFNEMVMLDLEYIKSQSIFLDLKILVRTPRIVLTGAGTY